MSKQFALEAESRADAGKGASRRLRRQAGKVPAIVYGDGKPPVNISVVHKDFAKALEDERFYSHIITLNIDGQAQPVLLKDLQRHPAKPAIMHADFQRVNMSKKVVVHIPLHFINEANCVGVKTQGGLISHTTSEIEVTCLPSDIPDYIEIDMLNVQAGQTIHISDLVMPNGVQSTQLLLGADHDHPIVNVYKPKAEDETPGKA